MPLTSKTVQNFQGLFTSYQKLAQPKGAISLDSNLWFSTRGALRTIPGSLIRTSPGDGAPAVNWKAIQYFFPSFASSYRLFALSITGASAAVYDVTGATWNAPALLTINAAGSYAKRPAVLGGNPQPTPGLVPYTDAMIVTITDSVPPYIMDGSTPPPPPVLSSVAGGALGATTYYVRLVYDGYASASTETSLAVGANRLLKVTSPPAPPAPLNATAYDVYVSTTPGTEQNQTAAIPIPIGTDWTEPATGLISGVQLAPDSPGGHQIDNNFNANALYGKWKPTHHYKQGAIIAIIVNNIQFEYEATQSGKSGDGSNTPGNPNGADNADVFPTQVNSTIVDGSTGWKCLGPVPGPPPGCAYAFSHLGFLWLWGVSSTYRADGITGPDALWQSGLNQAENYDPAFTGFVGKGNGETAQGGAVLTLEESGIAATQQLVLFKDASTYSVFGDFSTSIQILQAPGGVGCVAPHTVQYMANLGILRLSYKGITLFDGQNDNTELYTDPIRGYIFGLNDPTTNEVIISPLDWKNIQAAVSTQCKNPSCYVMIAPIDRGAGAGPGGPGGPAAPRYVCDNPGVIGPPPGAPVLFSADLKTYIPQTALGELFQAAGVLANGGDLYYDGQTVIATAFTTPAVIGVWTAKNGWTTPLVVDDANTYLGSNGIVGQPIRGPAAIDFDGTTYAVGGLDVNGNTIVYIATDPSAGPWTLVPLDNNAGFDGVLRLKWIQRLNKWIAIGEQIWTAPRGATPWTSRLNNGDFFGALYEDDTTIWVLGNTNLYSSTDGTTWSTHVYPTPRPSSTSGNSGAPNFYIASLGLWVASNISVFFSGGAHIGLMWATTPLGPWTLGFTSPNDQPTLPNDNFLEFEQVGPKVYATGITEFSIDVPVISISLVGGSYVAALSAPMTFTPSPGQLVLFSGVSNAVYNSGFTVISATPTSITFAMGFQSIVDGGEQAVITLDQITTGVAVGDVIVISSDNINANGPHTVLAVDQGSGSDPATVKYETGGGGPNQSSGRGLLVDNNYGPGVGGSILNGFLTTPIIATTTDGKTWTTVNPPLPEIPSFPEAGITGGPIAAPDGVSIGMGLNNGNFETTLAGPEVRKFSCVFSSDGGATIENEFRQGAFQKILDPTPGPTRMFIYDLEQQIWAIGDLPWPIGAAAFLPTLSEFESLIGQALDGTIRRIMNDEDLTWDGDEIVGSVRLPEFGRSSQPIYIRRFNIRGEGSGRITGVTERSKNVQGTYVAKTRIPPKLLTGPVDIQDKILSLHLDIGFAGQVEIEGVEYQIVEKKPTRTGR